MAHQGIVAVAVAAPLVLGEVAGGFRDPQGVAGRDPPTWLLSRLFKHAALLLIVPGSTRVQTLIYLDFAIEPYGRSNAANEQQHQPECPSL